MLLHVPLYQICVRNKFICNNTSNMCQKQITCAPNTRSNSSLIPIILESTLYYTISHRFILHVYTVPCSYKYSRWKKITKKITRAPERDQISRWSYSQDHPNPCSQRDIWPLFQKGSATIRSRICPLQNFSKLSARWCTIYRRYCTAALWELFREAAREWALGF